MGKKPFIDRKNAKHYQLVHRSQRDPLINDTEASSRVLLEVTSSNLRNKIIETSENVKQSEIESRVGQAALYGVYFDDTDYDYTQHLRPIGVNRDAVFIESPLRKEKGKKKGLEFVKNDEDDDTRISSSKRDEKVAIELPPEVLPSREEIPAEYFDRSAIPNDIQGFQPDMDPRLRETLEALEDVAYIQNDLDDDFFAALNAENLSDDGEGEEDFFEGEDEISPDLENWEKEFKRFQRIQKLKDIETGEEENIKSEDDIRSRATGYSMTSSAMFRNEKLTLLDEQFAKFRLKKNISRRQDFDQIMEEFLDKYEIVGHKMVPKLEGDSMVDKLETIRRGLGQVNIEDGTQKNIGKDNAWVDDEILDMSKESKRTREAWDCESILSTYSNLENHPAIIRDNEIPQFKVSTDRKTGMPIIV
ncbi:4156_t:CDS:2 [Ambispora leptoticha]|uniref:4156_t:CDS:1 n=1 Tax=Ambispora leptoticha TaxID=144679 RepID=A0A9N9C3G5_9GLOM|nr:4156_t:CDS:2 [Ambispora leptoticha]